MLSSEAGGAVAAREGRMHKMNDAPKDAINDMTDILNGLFGERDAVRSVLAGLLLSLPSATSQDAMKIANGLWETQSQPTGDKSTHYLQKGRSMLTNLEKIVSARQQKANVENADKPNDKNVA